MKLGIDLRCLPSDGSAGGGVAHAARAIADAMERRLGDRLIRYGIHGDRHALIRAIKERPCDILFVPSSAVSPGLPVPAVPWVHDCDIFDHPEWFPQSWLKRQMTTRMFLRGIRNAPHVFAVSEYTRTAVLRLCGLAQGKVTVTGEGGDEEIASMGRIKDQGSRGRDVLVLGTLEPRKNIPLICRVWPDVIKAIPDARLVIAGQDGWKTKKIYEAIHRAPSIIRRQNVSDEERRQLLLDAELVLVPSFSEGFGLVALEAIQAGTPVLTSNRGALPEVVGNGPWLLDPTDDAAWRDTMIRALSDDAFRQDIVTRQSARKELFSWEKTASRICDIIDANNSL